ncbi:MAG: PH domain-containing protein [Candidatus Zambryskibacteria bacterium]|nr:PH domain-containing protein [Candidatus Zambryskibacteria bacterium]
MKSLFSIFFDTKNSFEGEEDDERVILLIRRHPFFIILHLIFFTILFFVPIFLGLMFSNFLIVSGLSDVFFLLSSLWFILTWLLTFYSLTMYLLDVWIVTNKRIIDSTQHGFFNRKVSELHLKRIQDMSVEIKGVIQTLFTFGDLRVQTAGTEEKFKFLQIPFPLEAKDKIMGLITKENHF